MNIAQAKQEISNTVRAYTKKDQEGAYRIPVLHQRPVLLMGPPGIGKTAIVKQIAQEMGIGLVEYTLTHHTRQSAVGLPMLKTKLFGEQEYTVTEYTMSEIVASVYVCMEEKNVQEGILFLDEINCVSETLAPTMLQFLQCKTFGTHKLPKGWSIVAAGNPLAYNKSVREFDIVTLDRVKKIEVQEDYAVWKTYALQQGVHAAILAYLEIKKEKFYDIQETSEGSAFVTARGWEDLSNLMQVYEELDIPVTKDVIVQYVQQEETAEEFAGFYMLCRKYEQEYQIQHLFSKQGQTVKEVQAELFQKARFDERMTVLNLLLTSLHHRAEACQERRAFLEKLHTELLRLKKQLFSKAAADFQKELEDFLERRTHTQKVMEEKKLFSAQKLQQEKTLTAWLRTQLSAAKETRVYEPTAGFGLLKAAFQQETESLSQQEEQMKTALEQELQLLKASSAMGQELVLFLTGIAEDEAIMDFIIQHGCEVYVEEGKRLLRSRQETELKNRIQELQKTGKSGEF